MSVRETSIIKAGKEACGIGDQSNDFSTGMHIDVLFALKSHCMTQGISNRKRASV